MGTMATRYYLCFMWAFIMGSGAFICVDAFCDTDMQAGIVAGVFTLLYVVAALCSVNSTKSSLAD